MYVCGYLVIFFTVYSSVKSLLFYVYWELYIFIVDTLLNFNSGVTRCLKNY